MTIIPKYEIARTVDDLLRSALRKVNAYTDFDPPSVAIMEETREAFNAILDHEENKGVHIFQRDWRTRVFEASSIIDIAGVFYRCIRQYTSSDVSTWIDDTTYSYGDLVYPTVENGYYYKNITEENGKSGLVEPTFPEFQGEKVIDNEIEWEAILDPKPTIGKDWKRYWVEDGNQSSGTAYAVNTTYRRSGDFELRDDEASIERAFIRSAQTDSQLRIIRDQDYSDISHKSHEGMPEDMYLEFKSNNSTMIHLDPSPNLVGATGYVLHYQSGLKFQKYENSQDLQVPPQFYMALLWRVTAEIAPEHNIGITKQQFYEAKARDAMRVATKRDYPKESRPTIKSAF